MTLGRCRDKRCNEPVWWLRHTKTGKWAPIDMEPRRGGNVIVDVRNGTYSIVPKLERDANPETELHTNHFFTCPFADRFAKRKRPPPKRGPLLESARASEPDS